MADTQLSGCSLPVGLERGRHWASCLGMPGESQIRPGMCLFLFFGFFFGGGGRQAAASCRCFHYKKEKEEEEEKEKRLNAQPVGCNLRQVLPIPPP